MCKCTDCFVWQKKITKKIEIDLNMQTNDFLPCISSDFFKHIGVLIWSCSLCRRTRFLPLAVTPGVMVPHKESEVTKQRKFLNKNQTRGETTIWKTLFLWLTFYIWKKDTHVCDDILLFLHYNHRKVRQTRNALLVLYYYVILKGKR